MQVYPGCVHVRNLELKLLFVFVEALENEGQLAKNVCVDNSSHENANGTHNCLQCIFGQDVIAEKLTDNCVE